MQAPAHRENPGSAMPLPQFPHVGRGENSQSSLSGERPGTAREPDGPAPASMPGGCAHPHPVATGASSIPVQGAQLHLMI